MKLVNIFSNDQLQVYHVVNPTPKFKKHFPKKYNYSLIEYHNVNRGSSNKLPKITKWTIGYIFTYEPKVSIKQKTMDLLIDIGTTYPRCLDMYFSKNIDLILSCVNKHYSITPLMIDDVIIRCNSAKLSGVEDWKQLPDTRNEYISKHIKYGVESILTKMYSEPVKVVNWVSDVLDKFPTNVNGLPVKFPDVIKDNTTYPIQMENLFIEYDFRAHSEEHEKRFIQCIEDTFESDDYVVELSNSYNDILPNIIKQLKDQKLPYKIISDNTISLKWKDLKKVKYEYQITDFI